MGKNSIIFGMSLLGLLACVPSSKLKRDYGPEVKREILEYRGETDDYDVYAKEIMLGYHCEERIIILTGKNMSHETWNYVNHIWARDQGCDDRIDNWRLRGVFTSSVDKDILEQEVLNAFYKAKYASYP